MTTPPANQVVLGQGLGNPTVPNIVIAAGYATVQPASPPGAPVYDVRMTTIFPQIADWQATGITPFRSPGEKSPCSQANAHCMCIYIRIGPMSAYFIPERDLTYECQEAAP